MWDDSRTNFERSVAVVIGINDYQNGIHKLSTPVNDARVLADLLETEYEYREVIRLFPPYGEATLANLKELLLETLSKKIKVTEGDRLLFYFAGHGIARNSKDGPAGYLIPQDAHVGKLETFFPMRDLNAALSQLDCHHLLVILDCCFAGNFRWSSARNVIPVPETIHREHYDRFIRCSAWQAITSAAYNQEALDFLSDLRQQAKNSLHSPFALALIEGLKDNKADLTGDGVITAPELYLYLRDRLLDKDGASELQTPGLWPLQKHDRGEFVFTLPGFNPKTQLTEAPKLKQENNPYRGLQPYDEKHARFFFGRQELIEELYKRISQSDQSSSQLSVVVGISGSGKSSLVKAGLIPHLRKNHEKDWYILEPMRPGKSPFIALAKTIFPIANNFSDASKYKQLIRDLNKGESNRLIDILTEWIVAIVRAWNQANPQVKLLLTIDQFEELITMSRKPIPISPDTELDTNEQKPQRWLSKVFCRQSKAKNNERPKQKDDVQQEWQPFLALLVNTLKHCPQLHIVLTLRSDFEARFVESAFKDYWDKARFPVRAMRSDELREAIEKPASEMALYFEPTNAVDRLIGEVGEMPGALPLLSFTLSEFYIKLHQAWVEEGKEDRAVTVDEQFYQQGGIAGSLTYRANKIYDGLPDNAYRDTMRRVMLRMVETQGGEAVRRQVPESELVYTDGEENKRVNKVIKSLVDARLVVKGQETGEPYVEPAHDFLVRGWSKLQEWQEQAQKTLSIEVQRRLTQAANDWNITNKKREKQGLLWNNDPRLPLFEQVLPANALQQYKGDGKFQRLVRLLGKIVYSILQPKKEIVGEANQLNQRELEFVLKSVNWKHERLGQFVGGAVVILTVLSLALSLALIGQRSAVIGQVRTARQTAEAFFISGNQQLEALVEALRAEKTLKKNQLLQVWKPNKQLQVQVTEKLAEVLYKTKLYILLHQRAVNSASFSYDGNTIVTASNDKTARLWNRKGELLAELKGHRSPVRSASFSHDGNTIVTASDDKTARLWNRKGELLAELKGHQGIVNSAQFSPDGNTIVTVSFEKTARLWNRKGELLAELQGHRGVVNSARFSPDGADGTIVTASWDGTARVWDCNGKLLAELKGHQGVINSVSFSPDGNTIVTASEDKTARLWNRRGELLVELKGHQGPLKSASFSPDGNTIVTASLDGIARVWNRRGELLTELKGHQLGINSASFSPDGNTIVTASDDKTARLWNRKGEPLAGLQRHQDVVKSASFSPDGNTIVTASWDGTARVWNRSRELLAELQGHQGPVYNASFSPDGNTIVTASFDKTARLWNRKGELLVEFKGHQLGVNSASFSPDGNTIVTASDDKTTRLWNRKGQLLAQLQGHQDVVNNASFGLDGNTIVTASWDKTARLWNRRGELLVELKGHQGRVNSASFSSDGNTIVTASDDKTARLWNRKGRLLAQLQGHQDVVNSASFSPDGNTIVTASDDKTARLWNRKGELLAQLQGHQGGVRSASFSPDGNTIVTASDDHTAIVWNRKGELLAQLKEHQLRVRSASFSPDGNTIVTASDDNIARVWIVADYHDLLLEACARIGGYLNHYPDLDEANRNLCDGIDSSTLHQVNSSRLEQ